MPHDSSVVGVMGKYGDRVFKPTIEILGHVCSGFSKDYVGYASRMLTHNQR